MFGDIEEYLAGLHSRYRVRALKANKDFIQRLSQKYPDVSDGQIAYLFVNKYESVPVCYCGERCPWFENRFGIYCSRSCASLKNKSHLHFAKGSAHTPETKQRRRDSYLSKYGDTVSPKHRCRTNPRHLCETAPKTLFERYGVSNSGQLPDHATKIKATRERNPPPQQNKEKRMVFLNEKLATDVILEILDADKLLGQTNFRYRVRCLECSNEEIFPSETFKFRLRKTGKVCTICTGITTSRSFAEIELFNLFEDANASRRDLIHPYELDIYLPSKNLAIEYCGLYWHSEKAGKNRFYHWKKLDLCRKKDIRLITIFEDEWLTKPELVKSMLSNAVGANVERIYARKCEVVRLDEAKEFLTTNHIQGSGRSKVKYGLMHDGELVSVMTFSDSELSRKSVGWDINRFCSKMGTNVIGAAGKLFAHFVKEHDPEQVVSYADLRWGTGSVYGKLGFEHVGDSLPNYWYFRGEGPRKHRFGLRKTPQDDPNKTEWEVRQEEGWNRIWDCGHAKWVWKK